MGARKEQYLDCCGTEIIAELQNYYKVKDLDENKNYLDILNALYVPSEKLSYDAIAAKCFVSITFPGKCLAS